jgi:tetrahydromethanopterin S-methyltransferase subunit G
MNTILETIKSQNFIGENDMVFRVGILVMGVLMLTSSIVGINVGYDCIDDKKNVKYYDGEDSKEMESSRRAVKRNGKTLGLLGGVGASMILFSMVSTFSKPFAIIAMGVILSGASIVSVTGFNKISSKSESEVEEMSNNKKLKYNEIKNCDESIGKEIATSYGMLGTGIGLIVIPIVALILQSQESTSKHMPKIIIGLAALVSLIISSISINTKAQCDDKRSKPDANGVTPGTSKWVYMSYVTLPISILIPVAFIAYKVYIKRSQMIVGKNSVFNRNNFDDQE